MRTLLKQPSAFAPLAMSLVATLIVASYAVLHGTRPQPDEGTAAHLWQLLMAGQLPIIGYFAIRWLPHEPRAAAQVIGLHILGMLTAAAPVFLMGW